METASTDMNVYTDLLDCCDLCGEGHSTALCPELGPNVTQTEFDQLSTRARLTLPPYVQVADDGNGLVGVVARETIPNKTQLGPYEAKRTTHIFDDTGFFTLKLITKEGTTVCLDTTDENECNWLSLMRAATDSVNKNCIAYQLGSNIYYNTTRDIQPGEEMLVWYAPHFARKLGKPPEPDGETRVLLGHRIEPLTSDLLLDPETEEPTLYQADHSEEMNEAASEDVVQVPQVLDADKRTGEIRKAIYCPRCGNTFETQTQMVQHLREHVLSNGDTPRRGRGRPRKVQTIFVEAGGHEGQNAVEKTNERFKQPLKTYSKKRKMEEEEELDYDEGDNEDDFAEKVYKAELNTEDTDTEYVPRMGMPLSSTRVQPRRSTRGKHSKFDSDYVYGIVIKKEKTDPEYADAVDYKNTKVDSYNGLNTTPNMNGIKRGRGRPKKVKIEIGNISVEPAKDKSIGTLSEEIVKESLVALKDNRPSENDTESETAKANFAKTNSQKTDTDVLDTTKKIDSVNENITTTVILAVTDKINEFETLNDTHADINTSVEEENVNKTIQPFSDCQTTVKELDEKKQDIESDAGNSSTRVESEVESDSIQENDNSKDSEAERKIEIGTFKVFQVNEHVQTDKGDTQCSPSCNILMYRHMHQGFSCTACDQTVTNEPEAIKHMNQHNVGLRCTSCSKDLKQKLQEFTKYRKNGVKNPELNKSVENASDSGIYECDICNQTFKTANYLYRHMVIHTDNFKCEKCDNTFSRKDSLQKHVLKCCPELAGKYKIYYCEICLRVFSKESGKKRHKEKCKSVQCGMCLKIFTSEHELSIHKCKIQDMDDTAKYSCGRCAKGFQSLYYLKQHQDLHDSHIACDRCGKNFASKEELDSHKGLCSTLEGIRLYGSGKCNICPEVFSNSKVFRNHYMIHTHPFQCDKCEKRFLRTGTLNTHDCEVEPDSVCANCNRVFKNQANLEKHQKENGCMKYQCSACNVQFHSKALSRNHACIVKGIEDSDVRAEIISISNTREVCPTCGKSFSTKSNLTKHMLLHGEKKFKCPHCNKFFHLDVYLKEHITCVHYKISKYQCNVCGRLLKSKTGLIAHNRIFHAKNAEVYPCTKCGKNFKQKGNLRSHMYSHSKLRSFRCEVCYKAFKYPDQLSRHKLEHNANSYRIKCYHCDKDFLRSYDLKKHLQIYHSGYIYVCGICSARCGHRHTLIRHYKRKHPENLHLTTEAGYVNGLLKHYSQLYDSENTESTQTNCIVLGKIADKIITNGTEGTFESQTLSQEATEALNSLASGQVTEVQLQLLKDRGLFLQNEDENLILNQDGPFIQDQGQVIIPQDSYLFEEHTVEQEHTMGDTSEAVEVPAVNGAVGMIQNADGTVSINGIHGIPQTLEALNNAEGQVVILQIVDPESNGQQDEVGQFNTDSQTNVIQLTEEQSNLLQLNAGGGQVIDLGQGQQGEIISVGQGVYETNERCETSEFEDGTAVHTMIIKEAANTEKMNQDNSFTTELVQTDIANKFTSKESVHENDSVPVISLESGDPNIQAPIAYSQDVTCSEEIG